MNLIIAIILILLGLAFIIGGIFSKTPKSSPKVDLRIPGQVAPFAYLPSGIIFFSFGIFSILYPISHLLAYIVSITGILFAIVLYVKRNLKTGKAK